MKTQNSNLRPTEDDQLFDLLVDGQLDEPRRRELLSGLDEKPGGWRRCAMAFLEAQSWREAMDALAGAPTRADSPTVAQAAPRIKRRRHDYITTLLGMAASFLLAIGATSWMYQIAGGPGGSGPTIADSTGNPFAQGNKAVPTRAIDARSIADPGKDFHLVGLTSKGPNGQDTTVGLPAVNRNRLDEKWLNELPSAIPQQAIESLANSGHKVQGSRQLIPFKLKDGRRMVVPVDQLDVHLASYPEYQ